MKKAFSLTDKEMKAAKARRADMEKKAGLERSYKGKDGKPEGANSDYYAKQRKNLERTLKKEENQFSETELEEILAKIDSWED